jgi:hypothetical protein
MEREGEWENSRITMRIMKRTRRRGQTNLEGGRIHTFK